MPAREHRGLAGHRDVQLTEHSPHAGRCMLSAEDKHPMSIATIILIILIIALLGGFSGIGGGRFYGTGYYGGGGLGLIIVILLILILLGRV
jgi:hypothetical protein